MAKPAKPLPVEWIEDLPPVDVLIQMVNLQIDDARDSLEKNSKTPIDGGRNYAIVA